MVGPDMVGRMRRDRDGQGTQAGNPRLESHAAAVSEVAMRGAGTDEWMTGVGGDGWGRERRGWLAAG